ncbi:sigma-70 family RNA polymerase sigma factor [Halobacillus salinus]|uniref:Sigma-70 family RNA polymerase sigma factor n=1 Tax=Halobacillus salinus TaxID=192814 RepID=A0A4Z0GV83_9BACI|nr:sigma-70 family RNA polymerase sigma factor [Halobacillus salinus]TGB01118.1 sigma-70 family RNA polymerase sigma factor [Halobacillus salinus]
MEFESLPATNEEIDKDQLIHEFMNNYSKQVYLLAYSYVKDQGLAEDITQDVFLKCYRHLHKFREDASPKTWVLKITVNTAKDYIKKKSFHTLKLSIEKFENKLKGASVETEVVEQEKKDEVLEAVLSMKQKYREVIYFYYFQDLKIDEIKDALGLNENTVKTRLTRGRAILKEILQKEGLDHG